MTYEMNLRSERRIGFDEGSTSTKFDDVIALMNSEGWSFDHAAQVLRVPADKIEDFRAKIEFGQ